MVDSIYRTRSLGVGAEGLPDQYADGKAAKVWEFYIGSKQQRTSQYKQWFCDLLRNRGCQTVLDVACGTGVDSVMLLEAGFEVQSSDASDKMLKYALKERWNRRKESSFDKWVIEEANWLSLLDDLEGMTDLHPSEGEGQGFDSVICLGNSFAHLPDFTGNLSNQKLALTNFKDMLKPGGVLVIDHRNYDEILTSGRVPAKNLYYNSAYITDITCSNLYVNQRPALITLDYEMNITKIVSEEDIGKSFKHMDIEEFRCHKFRLSYYPHQLVEFTATLNEVFGQDCEHTVYGDFKPVGEVETPAYYIHIVRKRK